METIGDLRKFGGADAYLRSCPSRGVLDVIGSKWTVLIVGALIDRPMRFGELLRRLDGVTQKSLTQALRQLERDGFVTRTQYPTIPPRVDYELTPLGHRVAGLLGSIRDWAQENLVEVLAARARYDARPTGPDVRPA
ncbi:helix-turn-helix transcriptional regulator [Dactylosporangium sp. NBC_01737]|uniref:winged helix-turn-helix transcriptional regulator n=1 Tax=Dactylosporangium sp. NBC_01737 TaxID=2975959 RepID=UPI002E13ADC3|nr:helix-turn-helix transcriptional regulator [Dactylosporangium sp. NBC_01737]